MPPQRPPQRSTSQFLPRRQHTRRPPPLPTGTPHPSEKTSRRTSRVGRGRYVDEPGSRRVDGAAAFCGAAELSVRFGIRAPEAVVADVVCRAEAGVACGCPRGWESSWLWLWARWSPPRRRYSAQHDELIARRRADPVDDLVSALITAEADGDRLSTQELRSLITGLVLAGQDHTQPARPRAQAVRPTPQAMGAAGRAARARRIRSRGGDARTPDRHQHRTLVDRSEPGPAEGTAEPRSAVARR